MSPNKVSTSFTLLLFLTLSSGCEFELTEVYEPEREKDKPPPEITVNYITFLEDTIHLYRNTKFEFSFSSNDQKILGVKVRFNYKDIATFESNEGSFWLMYDDYFARSYNLSIEVYTNSGTGSLADQLDMEQYVLKRDWVVEVHKDN